MSRMSGSSSVTGRIPSITTEHTWLPDFRAENGSRVSIGEATDSLNNFWYTLVQDDVNKLVTFVFSYEFTVDGEPPKYIDLTLPFLIAKPYSHNVSFFGFTWDGTVEHIGVARVEAPHYIRDQFRVWCSSDHQATFSNTATNSFSMSGTVRID